MNTDIEKETLFKNIRYYLNFFIVEKYESTDAHADNTLDPTMAFVLLQLYYYKSKTFSYIVGGNSDIERALFCLNHLHMINESEHQDDHHMHIHCSLTNLGSEYAQSLFGGKHLYMMILNQYLFDIIFELMPFVLSLSYVIWYIFKHPEMFALCALCIGPGVIDIYGVLTINTKTGDRLIYRDIDDTKAQFIEFCNQHHLWNDVDPHHLINIVDHYMFNDYVYHKLPSVARHDNVFNRHYHG